jgi:dihydroorotate dehydrogenase (NAD+) catalytic subunit
VRFRNPVIAASGTFGYGHEYAGLLDIAALGGICTKGLTLRPKAGNTGCRLHETPAGLLNSIGLENPGVSAFIEHELPRMLALGPAGARPVIIANLAGGSLDDYAEGARLLAGAPIDMIELNISCPNVTAGGMAFGLECGPAAEVTSAVRSAAPHTPLIVKLSPNAPDMPAVAQAVVQAGADALSLVNTFKAMAIDIYRRKPVFDNVSAGLSGPAIRPIALRMVYELCHSGLNVPVIGMGGIASASDAVEFLLAGAAAVQVGAATFAHPPAMTEIIAGLAAYMQRMAFTRLGEIRMDTP